MHTIPGRIIAIFFICSLLVADSSGKRRSERSRNISSRRQSGNEKTEMRLMLQNLFRRSESQERQHWTYTYLPSPLYQALKWMDY
ncbi:Uncharacterised protein g10456 [Pycnogonum litorale]